MRFRRFMPLTPVLIAPSFGICGIRDIRSRFSRLNQATRATHTLIRPAELSSGPAVLLQTFRRLLLVLGRPDSLSGGARLALRAPEADVPLRPLFRLFLIRVARSPRRARLL